jgi:sugar fermentation stimulation protein A
MRFDGPLLPAHLRARLNRFLGVAIIGGTPVHCFIPNPGRLRELLHPGAKVYLLGKRSVSRKTLYDLAVVEKGGTLVSIDSRVPNRVVVEAIEAGLIPELCGLSIEKREFAFGGSRLDFLLRGGLDRMLLEVKSCTLVEDGTGLFPDAPTSRGQRHLEALMNGLAFGRAAVLFLVQRPDAVCLRPNDVTDPEFGRSLREAMRRGIGVFAYSSEVTLEGVLIKRRVPVLT